MLLQIFLGDTVFRLVLLEITHRSWPPSSCSSSSNRTGQRTGLWLTPEQPQQRETIRNRKLPLILSFSIGRFTKVRQHFICCEWSETKDHRDNAHHHWFGPPPPPKGQQQQQLVHLTIHRNYCQLNGSWIWGSIGGWICEWLDSFSSTRSLTPEWVNRRGLFHLLPILHPHKGQWCVSSSCRDSFHSREIPFM